MAQRMTRRSDDLRTNWEGLPMPCPRGTVPDPTFSVGGGSATKSPLRLVEDGLGATGEPVTNLASTHESNARTYSRWLPKTIVRGEGVLAEGASRRR